MAQVSVQQAIEFAAQQQGYGHLAHAESIYRQILQERKDLAEVHYKLGLLLLQQNYIPTAINSLEEAARLRPDVPQTHLALADAFHRAGSFARCIEEYRYSITLAPDSVRAHNNLGCTYLKLGQPQEAIACYEVARMLNPDLPDIHNNLSNALRQVGRLDEAIESVRKALSIHPKMAEAYNNLGNALQDSGRLDEAISAYQNALEIRPDFADAHANRSCALNERAMPDEALASAERTIELNPTMAMAHNCRGRALRQRGELDAAITAYRSAASLKPGEPNFQSNVIYALQLHPDQPIDQIVTDQKFFNDRFGKPSAAQIKPHSNDRNPDRRLRIGYVGADFRDHCQSFFTLPLLANHNRENVELFCYSNVVHPDAITQQHQQHVPHWRHIVAVSDAQVAQIVRNDKIDILIDLTLHMAGNRLGVFAHKPAPVQMTWLGYPGSTGLETIDYRITDRFLDPPGQHDDRYSEKSVHLPDSFWCYDPLTHDLPVNDLPALKNGHITFGCLNNPCKLNDKALRHWANVLQAVPDSRLILLAPPGQARARIEQTLIRESIDPTRIQWSQRLCRRDYLELYHQIDLALDSFPYTGHTTTLDGLWMGVPVLTVTGQTAVSCGGLSVLSQVGLSHYVANSPDGNSPDELVSIATSACADLSTLAAQRQSLRETMRRSPLMDAPRFARNMEAIYRQAWRTWAQGH